MADELIRKGIVNRTAFAMAEPGQGVKFQTIAQRVKAWRWAPEWHEGSIVAEPGMVRMDAAEGEAWVHPCGVITPDNGNASWCVTRTGVVRPAIGDIIIKHADGTRSVCKPAQFVQEYEPE